MAHLVCLPHSRNSPPQIQQRKKTESSVSRKEKKILKAEHQQKQDDSASKTRHSDTHASTELGWAVQVVIPPVMYVVHDIMQNLDSKSARTTEIKHLLLSFSVALSIVYPCLSCLVLISTVGLIVVWADLKRFDEECQAERQSSRNPTRLHKFYEFVKTRILENHTQSVQNAERPAESSMETLRNELGEVNSGTEEAPEETETTLRSRERDAVPPGSPAAACQEEEVCTDFSCLRENVMRELHAKEIGRIFEKAAKRMVTRQCLLQILPEADVNRIIVDHVAKTEALANQWMRLWQEGAHARLALSDIWRLLLDLQERTLQDRLLLLPSRRSS